MAFLERQIRSIQSQTSGGWRCHLHDDASGDTEAVERMVAADDRIALHLHPARLGVVGSAARAIGMLPRDSKIVFFADQDDIWEPHKVERFCQAFDANPQWQLIHSDMALVDSQDHVTEASCFAFQQRAVANVSPESLLVRSVVTGCSMAVRFDLLSRAMPLKTDARPTVYHDRWIAMVAALDDAIGVLNEPLTRYRQHGANQLGAVSPADRARQFRRAPMQKLKDAWAERLAFLNALERWGRTRNLTPAARSMLDTILTWRSRYSPGLWRYSLALRRRAWVDRRAALGLAVGRLLVGPGEQNHS
ncbi:MAG: glycosyltransferase [Pseudomonadota bacterium]